ncbi:glycosyltransferase [Enterococcus sp. LJL90]
MKILFCQTQFKMGGQQKVLLTIAKELSKNYEVQVYYENYDFFDLSGLNTIRPSKITQLKNLILTVIVALSKLNFKKKVVADDWHFRNLKSTLTGKDYDVVILLNPYILFVNKLKNEIITTKKIVCWTHNLYENYVDDRFKNQKLELFTNMAAADQIISLEKYTASKWKSINPSTLIIHNPVTIDNDGKISSLESKVVSFVGRIHIDSKGIDYLCNVAKFLDEGIIINVAGSGDAKNEKKFLELIKDNKLENKIFWKKALKEEQLKEHYRNSSIFLMTSRYEGFPLVAAEAMSFGLPIVAFDIPSLREVTDDGKYGKLIDFGDVESMAAWINNLFDNKDEMIEYSKKSLRRVEDLKVDTIISEWEKKVLVE